MQPDMPRPLPPYVQVHRRASGEVVYYFRRDRGHRVRLPAPTASDFEAAYAACLAGSTERKSPPSRAPKGTLRWLVEQWQRSGSARLCRAAWHWSCGRDVRLMPAPLPKEDGQDLSQMRIEPGSMDWRRRKRRSRSESCLPEMGTPLYRRKTMTEWKPISSAPKDGTPFVAYYPAEDDQPASVDIVSYPRDREHARYYGLTIGGVDPTHWVSLPPPPETKP